MIADRRNAGTTNEKADLFNLLLEANSEFDLNAPLSLTDEELIGNLFTFILGGHEVRFVYTHKLDMSTKGQHQGTAYTLSFALGALAIYGEEQETVFDEVNKVFDQINDHPPVRIDLSSKNFEKGQISDSLNPTYSRMMHWHLSHTLWQWFMRRCECFLQSMLFQNTVL